MLTLYNLATKLNLSPNQVRDRLEALSGALTGLELARPGKATLYDPRVELGLQEFLKMEDGQKTLSEVATQLKPQLPKVFAVRPGTTFEPSSNNGQGQGEPGSSTALAAEDPQSVAKRLDDLEKTVQLMQSLLLEKEKQIGILLDIVQNRLPPGPQEAARMKKRWWQFWR